MNVKSRVVRLEQKQPNRESSSRIFELIKQNIMKIKQYSRDGNLAVLPTEDQAEYLRQEREEEEWKDAYDTRYGAVDILGEGGLQRFNQQLKRFNETFREHIEWRKKKGCEYPVG